MNKIILRLFVIAGAINLFLVLTGIVLPHLISTDKLAAFGIIFFITTIFFAVFTAALIVWKIFMEKPKRRRKKNGI